jgi:aryl-phospho-beta-D-glucosidase BglC (GH1 family)
MGFRKFCTASVIVLSMATSIMALPKATVVYEKMGIGFNIGNTMEVPGNPTGWGNPVPNQTYADSIKAAGFNTVRIPCAWDSHASNGSVNEGWLDSVKAVVDYVLSTGAYVVLNSHWDNGWLEDHVFDGQGYDKTGQVNSSANSVAAKQSKYWTQIANKFKDYNERLIFACANEPGVNDPWNGGADNGQWAFDATRMKVLKQFHEACINAIRTTGGNNATRIIVVQMPRTEVDKYQLLASNYPADPAGDGYTMAEAHFYPYQFSLMEDDADWGKVFYFWEDVTTGDASRTASGNANGSKSYIDGQFDKLKNAFVNKGIPVIIGEMGAINRGESLSGNDRSKHLEARSAWYAYTVKSAKAHGIVPIVWDTGYEGKNNMTIIRRQSGTMGSVFDLQTLNAMRNAIGLADYVNNGVTHVNDFIGGSPVPESSSSVSSSSSSNEGTTAVRVLTNESVQLVRTGNILSSNAEIRLFDVNGNLIRMSNHSHYRNQISLDGLCRGVYIAKSKNEVVRIVFE